MPMGISLSTAGLPFQQNVIAQILGGASFFAPLRKSLVLSAGTGDPTFTRATTGTVSDNEGILRTAIAGEARFTGARRVRNRVSTAYNTDDANTWGTTGVLSSVTPNAIDGPISGTTAAKIDFGANTNCGKYVVTGSAMTSGGKFVISVYLKADSAGTINLEDSSGVAATVACSVTTEWQRFELTAATVSGAGNGGAWVKRINSGQLSSVYVFGAQTEDVTGQSVQTAAEYVSVGGVPTPVANNYLRLAGGAGNYASTPDSVAASITGGIDIRVKFSSTAFATGNQFLASKLLTGGNYSYDFYVSSGSLVLRVSTDGSATKTASVLASGSFSDNTVAWARATRSAASGDVKFYSSADGETWVQVGATQSTAAGGIFDGTETLAIGAQPGGGGNPLSGKIYRAQIYNGINGTLAVDFDPTRYTGSYNGATMTAATGEVWTLNSTAPTTLSGARITSDANFAFGYPNHGGAGVDGVAYFDTDIAGNPIAASTLKGYLAEGARTNLVWPSEDLTSVRYVSGGGGIAVVADQAVAPDGTTTADQLTASGANGTLIQDLGVIASTAQCFSIYLKRKTGTGNVDITLDGGATWTTQTINTTTWTRCELTQTLANPDVGIRIVTSGDAVYAWGLQCE